MLKYRLISSEYYNIVYTYFPEGQDAAGLIAWYWNNGEEK